MPDLDGVVLTYWGLKLKQKTGKIMFDHSHFHFRVGVQMLLFRPIAGIRLGTYLSVSMPRTIFLIQHFCFVIFISLRNLVGVVHQVGYDHIGLLVFGLFNATISSDSIGKEFERNRQYDGWTHVDNPRCEITMGSIVRFCVSG